MRFPRASAVIVALSTFVAVATVAALASQLVPFDRAGAALPDGPITIDAPVADENPLDVTSEVPTDPAPAPGSPGGAAPGASGEQATVVVPAPAEPVEPEPEPEPASPPASPGNSGNAPGQSGAPGGGATPPGHDKP